MPAQWYAINSHPHREGSLAKFLEEKGFEVFYPHLKVKPVNPRSRRIRPYFPGYLFVRVDLDETGLSVFQWTPFAKGLVAFGGEPAVVPEALIHTLMQHLERLNRSLQEAAAQQETFTKGETVLIESGPFAGYEAIFDVQLPGRERARVLLKLLGDRHLPLELDTHQLQRPPRPS